MNQHLHIITPGVMDLEASRRFYGETLGWKPSSASSERITFFQAGFRLAYNAQSKAEVDAAIAELRLKGVQMVKEPQKVFWGGYSSYFADPDGYRWQVAFNPFLGFDEDGKLKME